MLANPSRFETEIEYWKNRFILISKNNASLIDVNKSPFVLEKYLPKQKKIEFLDVGSGPFSRCGGYSKDHVLNMTYVDPLGNVYENLKSIYKVSNGVFVKRGFVELLDKIFGKNSFDVVHMSNALDHCFDPIFGLMQLISVCKIGGKVILRHNENEALNEQYSGLHQWNIAINNDKFMIWNEIKTIDVNEILSDFVDFKLSKNEVEDFGGWNYCHIEMTKKKDIEIHIDPTMLLMAPKPNIDAKAIIKPPIIPENEPITAPSFLSILTYSSYPVLR